MRQNFIAQFIQLLKHWLCGQVLSWRRTGPFLLTNAGCRHCSFWCISSIYTLFRCNGFIGIQKVVVDQTGIISDHDLFLGCKFGFGKCFGASSWSNHWAGRVGPIQSTFRCMSLSDWEMALLHRKKEDDTSKWQFFWFAISSCGTHLSSIFTFPICFHCQKTIGWLTLSSWATSHVVVRG